MKKLIIASFVVSIACISSCNKEEVKPNEMTESNIIAKPSTNTNSETFSNIQSYFNTWQSSPDNFQFQANVGGTFTTQKGSVLSIPANAFSYTNNTIATGQVNIKIKEVYSTKEMIHSNIFPISNDYVLNSGGQFFIEAKQNGTPLIVTNGTLIDLKIPAQAEAANMELFLAGPEEDEANWQPIDSAVNGGGAPSGFTFNSADDTYSINLDSLGWGNIDAFMYNITYFDCEFNLIGLNNLNNANTTAFAVFKDQNSVWPTGVSGWGSISNNVINETHLADVPMNVIVISVVDGQLYYGLLDITPVQGQVYNINMTATDSETLDNIIENLE